MNVDEISPGVGRVRILGVFLLVSALVHGLLLTWSFRYAPKPPVAVPGDVITLTLSNPAPAVPGPAAEPNTGAPAVRPAVSGGRRPAAVPKVNRASASSGTARAPAVDLSSAAIRAAADAVVGAQSEAAARGKAGRLPPDTPEPKKSPLQKSLEAGARPDCRHAYSGMGLLAIVPLALDAATDRGCRW